MSKTSNIKLWGWARGKLLITELWELVICKNWNCFIILDVESVFLGFFWAYPQVKLLSPVWGKEPPREKKEGLNPNPVRRAEMMLFGVRVQLESFFCLLAVFWICIYPFRKGKHILLYSSDSVCQSMTLISCFTYEYKLNDHIWCFPLMAS